MIVSQVNDLVNKELNTSNTKRKSTKGSGKAMIIEYKENYVISVIKSESDILHNNNYYTLISSTKSNGYYTTKELNVLSDKIKSLNFKYQKYAKEYMTKILNISLSYIYLLYNLNYVISEIDVHCSFAHVITSSLNKYTKPIITNDKILDIKQGRHFILDQNLDLIVTNYNKNTNYFIPNDCYLDINNTVMLITGVNMGGKSTYIRQVALIVYLAHIGMYIPAEDNSIIPITDRIITRVGADDNILKGLSTFFMEMTEVSSLFKVATEKSLLIIDEIGRGTSTIDGMSLSQSILESIATNINSFCLYATHFHELTGLSTSKVENYFIDYVVNDENGLDIKYKMVKGTSNKSLGIQLIKQMGIKDLEDIIYQYPDLLN